MDAPRVEKILVAVDFSPTSETALRQAVALANSFGASLTAAHVITDLRGALEAMPANARWKLVAGDIDEFERSLRQDSNTKLTALVAQHAGGMTVETVTLVGQAYAELIRTVQRRGYSLVVAGTLGNTTIKKLLLGSTADKLAHYCPAPVWIVPPGEQIPLTKILVPVDFSAVSAKALQLAGALAERYQASLHVLHVLDHEDLMSLPPVAEQPDKQLGEFRKELKKSSAEHLRDFVTPLLPAGAEPEFLLAHGTPWQLIDSNAKRLDASLIVMGSVGRGGLAGMLFGNTAEKVLNQSKRPLLIVKPDGFECPVAPAIVD